MRQSHSKIWLYIWRRAAGKNVVAVIEKVPVKYNCLLKSPIFPLNAQIKQNDIWQNYKFNARTFLLNMFGIQREDGMKPAGHLKRLKNGEIMNAAARLGSVCVCIIVYPTSFYYAIVETLWP